MSTPHPAVSPQARYQSGISTLRAVLLVDVVFGVLGVALLTTPQGAEQLGEGITLLVALVLLAVLRTRRHWRWALAGWVAFDLVREGALPGGSPLWLIFTALVAAYVYWACTSGERGMKNAAAADVGT